LRYITDKSHLFLIYFPELTMVKQFPIGENIFEVFLFRS